jgi:EmrB/QacA subfamily drug resistance transporter
VTRPARRQWPVVLAVQLAVLLAALDATVVGTAMPTVIATLGSVRLYPWVFSAYMLASTVVMPVFGALSDRLGRKGPYLAAVAIFGVGSFVAGAAPSMAILIAGRAIQGIGAGGLLALSLIVFGDLFAGPRRGQMQGWITGVWGVASVVGPVLGGVIVDAWGWPWVFYPNLPLGALVMLLLGLALRESGAPAPRHRLDLAGAATFLAGVTAFMVAVLQSPAAAGGRGLLVLATAGLGAFVLVERRAADPLLPPGLFREAPFAVGCAASFFSGAAMFGALIHVPLLVQWGQGTDATRAGLSLMTMSTGWAAGGLAAGQVVNRVGFWRLTVAGLALMTVGYGVLAWRPGLAWRALLGVGALVGIGMGLASITLVVAIQTLISRERRGVATSGILFFRNVGATVGVAVMGATLTARLGLDPALLDAGGRVAVVAGMGPVFALGVAACLLGLVAALFLPRGSPRAAEFGGGPGSTGPSSPLPGPRPQAGEEPGGGLAPGRRPSTPGGRPSTPGRRPSNGGGGSRQEVPG